MTFIANFGCPSASRPVLHDMSGFLSMVRPRFSTILWYLTPAIEQRSKNDDRRPDDATGRRMKNDVEQPSLSSHSNCQIRISKPIFLVYLHTFTYIYTYWWSVMRVYGNKHVKTMIPKPILVWCWWRLYGLGRNSSELDSECLGIWDFSGELLKSPFCSLFPIPSPLDKWPWMFSLCSTGYPPNFLNNKLQNDSCLLKVPGNTTNSLSQRTSFSLWTSITIIFSRVRMVEICWSHQKKDTSYFLAQDSSRSSRTSATGTTLQYQTWRENDMPRFLMGISIALEHIGNHLEMSNLPLPCSTTKFIPWFLLV